MQLEVDFNFVTLNEDDDFDNNTQHIIQYSLVEMLRDYGYGDIIRDENGNYINTHIHPFVVGYVGDGQHEIFIGYMFQITNDALNGDIALLLSQGIPNFYNNIINRLRDIHVFIRTTYVAE